MKQSIVHRLAWGLISVACFFVCFGGTPAEAEQPTVTKKIVSVDYADASTIATYQLAQGDCSLVWEVSVLKDDEQTILLRPRQPLGVKCDRPFADQLPLHRQILEAVFADWPQARFRTLFIGPLEKMAPTGIWNARVAMASATSDEWRDWRQNYPDHKSGKSINQLFVELVESSDACQELVALFEEFGMNIKMNSVEKVFAQPAKALPFYSTLQSQGLTGNPKLIYDAGMIYFSMYSI